MVQLYDGRWILLGIVSYGSSCSQLFEMNVKPLVQVYTNVKMYSGQIDKFTEYILPWKKI